MRKRRLLFVLVCTVAVSLIVACGEGLEPVFSSENRAATGGAQADPADYGGDGSEVTQIVLNGNAIIVNGDGATADGSQVTIHAAGTYSISGYLADGQIVVDTEDAGTVGLILNGVDIRSSTAAPIYVAKAEEAAIILADGTDNYVSDGPSRTVENGEEDELDAAIFSRETLTIEGGGSLTVVGNYLDGIVSKDGLTLASGALMVIAADDGIRGRDYLVITGGQITVTAQGDGLKSGNDEDASMGTVAVEAGTLNVTAGGDALQAQTSVTITDGDLTLSSGGGSSVWIDETTSAKGIKATVSVTIDGGTFTIDSADDGIHSNDSMVINGGTFTIASGDDGMHADSTLEVNAGDIDITQSYEGIESAVITINGGTICIVSSDDGLNVAGGNDGSGRNRMPGQGGAPVQGGRPGQGGQPWQGGGPGQDGFAVTGDYHLIINGGHIVINAAGDGIDVNGTIEMADGVVLVNGPTERMNGALDCDGGFTITGGFLVAVGSSGMAQAPGDWSSQYSLLLNYNATFPAGTLIHIQDGAGNDVLTFAPAKDYQSIAFSSPDLVAGSAYAVYYGGSASGTADGGLYPGGTYAAGTQYTSFAVSSIVTRLGNVGRW